jgi:hypothetical protein
MKRILILSLGLLPIMGTLHAEPAPQPWARWSFEAAPLPAPDCPAPAAFRGEGVHGSGLLLSGEHQLKVSLPPHVGALTALTFSAWARPTDFDHYNEIFRQECPDRLLFSFQEYGTVLSLGLNIGGYLECDAPIDPEVLLDGAWHHCAATFDGETMRVFLDGKQIGAQVRRGVVRFNPAVAAFIGSMGGRSEFFQGGLDEVTLFACALSAEQIRIEWQCGAAALAKRGAACGGVPGLRTTPLTYHTEEWYGSTFWAGSQWTRVGKDWQHPDVETPSVRRFCVPRDGRVNISGRVFKLHLEGDGIRASILHNEREVWKAEIEGKDSKGVEPKLTLDVKQGDALRFVVHKRVGIACDTTGWDPVIAYTDGERFQASSSFAAHKQGAGGWFYEALGHTTKSARKKSIARSSPLLSTETMPEPPTVALPSADADKLLVVDWQAQRGTTDCAAACRQELARAERILTRISERLAPTARAKWQQKLAELRQRAANEDTYLALRKMKRELLLADPEIDFSKIICIDNPYVHGSEAIHEVRHRNEDTATPGGRLLVLDGLRPDAAVRKLAPRGVPAAFWRPDVSFDGRRVLFCMKATNEPAFHLYEVGLDPSTSLGAGGSWRQITDGDYNDLDPIYAPDGGIIFSTSRCNHYLRCGGSKFRMFILARCDRDGKNIYFISANNEVDYMPSFLPDGRLIYTRWEYVDKDVLRIQSLWTVNPDGTAANAFWGNQSKWPDMLLNPRAIPGTTKVIFNATGHHDAYAGPLGIIVPGEGMNYPDGLYNLTPHVPWAEVGNGPAEKTNTAEFVAPACFGAYLAPFPISKDLLLVSARVGPPLPTGNQPELPYFQLYLMDFDGNMELLFKGAYNVLHAQPVRPRALPRVIPSTVRWPGKMTAPDQQAEPGVLLSADIYEGSGIPRGLVKSLRVLEIESQSWCDGKRSTGVEASLYRSKGAFPTYTLAGETPTSFLYDDATKRILGTVPVESDGSVHFKLPPVRSVYFQLLDERGRCLQTMRSFTHVMPGEKRGCVGCHQTRGVTPGLKPCLAANRAPSEITPPPWGDATISFPRFVQPILDKHCVKCHGSTALTTGGGAQPKAGLDLTHRTEPGTLLSWPYVKLVFGNNPRTIADLPNTTIAGPIFPYHVYPNPEVNFPTEDTVVPPLTAMSYRSKLIAMATSGKHGGVRVSPEEEARLVAWVDALCPYLGLEEIIAQPDIAPPDYYAQGVYKGLSFPSKMCTAPVVHKAFCQDDFKTQADRQPKDAAGQPLPSFEMKDGKRIYHIPAARQP